MKNYSLGYSRVPFLTAYPVQVDTKCKLGKNKIDKYKGIINNPTKSNILLTGNLPNFLQKYYV